MNRTHIGWLLGFALLVMILPNPLWAQQEVAEPQSTEAQDTTEAPAPEPVPAEADKEVVIEDVTAAPQTESADSESGEVVGTGETPRTGLA